MKRELLAPEGTLVLAQLRIRAAIGVQRRGKTHRCGRATKERGVDNNAAMSMSTVEDAVTE
jgi:hypothetical protein